MRGLCNTQEEEGRVGESGGGREEEQLPLPMPK